MSAAGPASAPAVAASNRKLAINRLRERRPLDAGTVDRFLARYEVPIVEGPRCTFLFRGEADEVFLVHRIFGLPGPTPMRRLRGTDLWYVVLELPEGSRIEYQLEVVRGGQRSRFNDPLNPRLARSPVGDSSVCYAHGYVVPDWTLFDPEARPGSLVDMVVPSRALRRETRVTLYLPARFRRSARYPLLIVHDGGDYLSFASAKTVLDNLIHRLDVAELVGAFVYPGDRLAEYANSAAHARYLTAELLPGWSDFRSGPGLLRGLLQRDAVAAVPRRHRAARVPSPVVGRVRDGQPVVRAGRRGPGGARGDDLGA